MAADQRRPAGRAADGDERAARRRRVGFTDDGRPVVSAGLLRAALRYQQLCGASSRLHEEDPALSGAGVMHEGAVSTVLGLEGIPSISEST